MKSRIFLEKFLTTDYANVDSLAVRDLKAQVEQFQNFSGFGLNDADAITTEFLQGALGVLGAAVLTVSLFTQKVPQESPLAVLNSPVTVPLLLALMLLMSFVGSKLMGRPGKNKEKLADAAILGNRKYSAYFSLMLDDKRRADIRTYRQQEAVAGYLRETAFSPGGAFDRCNKGFSSVLSGVGSGMSAVFTGIAYLFTCLKAWAGAFGVGSVTQYVSALTSLSGNLNKTLAAVEKIRTNHRFLVMTYRLLDIPDEMYRGTLTTEKRSDRRYEVEFCDVSFQYPGRDDWALRHVNMKFQLGKRLAIVGENGSGKTTFIKLLCRLHDPQEGEIRLNGIDIRKYRYDDYMQLLSVVFQDFELLSASLGSNVAGSKHYDRQKAEKALRDAGFGDRLNSWKNGLDTQLYKEMDESGVTVSGGEAQKIAIARALYKDAPFIILDEPTAALDPIAEAEIYSKFDEITGDKTAIYISHRLSSCKFCDEIAVFDHGAVIQHGTHESLLAEPDGKYFDLWHAQAQYYAE